MTSEAITIARAELTAEISRGLIASLNAELNDLYPEPGANHFQLDLLEHHDEDRGLEHAAAGQVHACRSRFIRRMARVKRAFERHVSVTVCPMAFV
jgi:hypothetical protein